MGCGRRTMESASISSRVHRFNFEREAVSCLAFSDVDSNSSQFDMEYSARREDIHSTYPQISLPSYHGYQLAHH